MSNCATGTVICSISELCVLRFTGDDRVTFLQGQVTNDVTKLTGSLMTAGYCSPKGRLIATMRLWADDDAIYAIVPTEQAPALLKRLKMFILRSKVSVELLNDARVVGLVGQLPERLGDAVVWEQLDAAVQTRIGAALPQGRGMCVVSETDLQALDAQPSTYYWLATVAAGDPWIFEATRELFVPQGINLELVGGVSFRKGCYTGQEVVSRVQHIGKTPRRAFLFGCSKEIDLKAGQDVTTAEGVPAGIVVQSCAVSGRTLALIQCESAKMDGLTLRVGEDELSDLPLPYAV
jgi:folate-binding protein YgfZ